MNETWMAAGSRFTGTSANFTDRITLMPTPSALPDQFTAWASASGLDSGNRSATDNPDGDQLNNLLEYASGMDPLLPGETTLSTTSNSLSGLPVVFHRPGSGPLIRYLQRTQDLRLRQELEISSDLKTDRKSVV